MLMFPVVGLLSRGAAIVNVKTGALEDGALRTAIAAHVIQGWGWLDTIRHLFYHTLGGMCLFCDICPILAHSSSIFQV